MNNCDITLHVGIAIPLDQRFIHQLCALLSQDTFQLHPSIKGYFSVVSLLCSFIHPRKVIHYKVIYYKCKLNVLVKVDKRHRGIVCYNILLH